MSTPALSELSPAWIAAIDGYLDWRRLEQLSAQSIHLRGYHLRRFAYESELPDPWQVTFSDLTGWLSEHTWGKETLASVVASLRTFYAWGVMAGHLASSPGAHLPRHGRQIGRPNPIPEQQYQDALRTTTDPRVHLAIRLAGDLGLRRAEIAAVHRDHLAHDGTGWLLTIMGKGSRERIIPISERLTTDLQAHIDEHGANGWAFPAPGGTRPLTAHWLGTLMARVLPADFTAHKLRHRALTRVYNASKDILLTSALAGHASVRTTQAYYVKPDYSAMRAVIEEIAS